MSRVRFSPPAPRILVQGGKLSKLRTGLAPATVLRRGFGAEPVDHLSPARRRYSRATGCALAAAVPGTPLNRQPVPTDVRRASHVYILSAPRWAAPQCLAPSTLSLSAHHNCQT